MSLNWSVLRGTALRILPGADLKNELIAVTRNEGLKAAAVISAVGSLTNVSLRLAGGSATTQVQGKHEIISLSGTLSKEGVHLHMSVANSDGQMLGGHVMEGSIIFTTAEIVIAEFNDLDFSREHCPSTGYKELVVKPKSYRAAN